MNKLLIARELRRIAVNIIDPDDAFTEIKQLVLEKKSIDPILEKSIARDGGSSLDYAKFLIQNEIPVPFIIEKRIRESATISEEYAEFLIQNKMIIPAPIEEAIAKNRTVSTLYSEFLIRNGKDVPMIIENASLRKQDKEITKDIESSYKQAIVLFDNGQKITEELKNDLRSEIRYAYLYVEYLTENNRQDAIPSDLMSFVNSSAKYRLKYKKLLNELKNREENNALNEKQ